MVAEFENCIENIHPHGERCYFLRHARAAFYRMDNAVKELMSDLETLETYAFDLAETFLRTGTFQSVRPPEAFKRLRTKIYKHRSKVGCFARKFFPSGLVGSVRTPPSKE